ncbi:low-density lipoprotein receptor-related protein 12-like [Mercenaria mercenaria]|uniref:low-density lipoprotein receptor-related protein 12-like n=1 Tax=Mercenaria mercenaria TaxID=6596 RepID=UPI00234ECFE7|nr:low-density lipoprotein receptor-related protein 12-like [Mercenaria mercenaria]
MILLLVYLISTIYLHNVAALLSYYMDDNCNGTVDLTDIDSILLQLTKKSTYQPDIDCSLLISSTKYDQFMLYFMHFDISSDEQQGCTEDWLEVHDGNNVKSPSVAGIPKRLCGSYIRDSVRLSTGNNVFLRFISGEAWEEKGFDMVITQYHTGSCDANEQSCRNGRCITSSLVCNGYNPCGDNSDCSAGHKMNPTATIVATVFAVIFLSL